MVIIESPKRRKDQQKIYLVVCLKCITFTWNHSTSFCPVIQSSFFGNIIGQITQNKWIVGETVVVFLFFSFFYFLFFFFLLVSAKPSLLIDKTIVWFCIAQTRILRTGDVNFHTLLVTMTARRSLRRDMSIIALSALSALITHPRNKPLVEKKVLWTP